MRSAILALLAGALVEGQGLPGLPPLPIVGGLLGGLNPPTPSLPTVPADVPSGTPDVPTDLPAAPPLPTGGLPAVPGAPALPPLPAGLPALPKERRQASTGADGIDIGQIIADAVGPNLAGRQASTGAGGVDVDQIIADVGGPDLQDRDPQQGSTLNVNGMDVGGVLAGLPVPKGVLPVQALGVTKRAEIDPEDDAEIDSAIDGIEGEIDDANAKRQDPDLDLDVSSPDPSVLDDSTNARLSITDPAVLPTDAPAPDVMADVARWHTSTVFVTNTITISTCAPTHSDCPYTRHPLTTITVETSTTVCPLTSSTSGTWTSSGGGGGETSTWCDGCDETTTVCTETETGTGTATSSDSGTTSTTDCADGRTTSWTSSESCTDTGTETGTSTSSQGGETTSTSSCDGRWCHHTRTKTCTEERCHDPTSSAGGDPTSYSQVVNAAPSAGAGVAGLLAGLAVVLL